MEKSNKKLNYPECSKSGFHSGEALNFICLENSKIKSLACSICIDEEKNEK